MTNKKFLFIGMAVLLSVSLFLTGCGDPADGAEGLPGQEGQNGSNGGDAPLALSGPWSVDALKGVIALYEDSDAGLLVGNLSVTGGGVVDFGSSKVHVTGSLGTDTDNSTGVAVLNLQAANVTFAEGAKVALGDTDDVAVLTTAQLAYKGATGKYAPVVSGPADFGNVVGNITAVENLTLTQAGTIPANLKVYVFGTFTVDGAVPGTVAGQIIAIKDVAVYGTTGDLFTVAKTDVSLAQISVKSGETAATVKLPATFDGRFALAAGELTLTSDTTDLTAYMLPGNGVLKLAAETVTAAITGNGRIAYLGDAAIALASGSSIETGTGYVSFPNGIAQVSSATITLGGSVAIGTGKTIVIPATSGSVTLTSGSAVYAGATPAAGNEILTASGDGDVVLSGDAAVLTFTAANQKLDVATADLKVAGDVAFGGDLTLTGKGVELSGVATFAPGAVVTMTAATSTITLVQDTGSGIAVGEGRFPYNAIFSNESADTDAKLTPEAGTTLTFGANRTLTQNAASSGHSIEITGKLGMPSGATYVVASEASNVGTLKVKTTGDDVLTLGAGVLGNSETADDLSSSLVLTGATGTDGALLKGAGKVVAGDTEIVGGTSGWQAVGADTSIAITAGAITGTGTDATLKAQGTDTDAVITQLAVEGNNLVIAANTIIDLSYNSGKVGSIELTQSATVPGKVTLTDATSVILVKGGTKGDALTEAAGDFVTTTANDKLVCSTIAAGTGVAVYKVSSETNLHSVTGGTGISTVSGGNKGTGVSTLSGASAVS
jgi:hypothetical protein